MNPADTLLDRRTLIGGLILAGTLVEPALARPVADPVATTRHGRVRGRVQDGVHRFLGIRYGADTAPRRFRPAPPPEPWGEIRDALAYGPAAPQREIDETTSEDCLFLNVWTPGLDAARRPVMVYFHGGAHASGSGSSPLYDGTRLCARGDVVVVTVNHRLNILGYGYFARLGGPELADSGNVGNLDLILALRWVRENIAAFGGDPGRVTIFGQSGGGAKVVTLMAMPPAAGLFHRAATMSGQHVTCMGPRHASIRARAVLDHFKIPPARMAELRTMPVARLIEALELPDPIEANQRILFWSVLDGRSTPRHPFYPGAPIQSARIPLICGTTHDETRYFLRGDERNFHLSWDELPAKLDAEMVADLDPAMVVARYRQLYPHYSPSDVLFAASTAGRSWRGSLIQAEERARIGAPTWAYQLDFPSPAEGGRLGAFHTLDIPLVFDNVDRPGSMTGTSPEARRVAAAMSESLIALARTGSPQHAGIPHWPHFTLPRRATMIFDRTLKVIDDPRREERELFAVAPYLKPGT